MKPNHPSSRRVLRGAVSVLILSLVTGCGAGDASSTKPIPAGAEAKSGRVREPAVAGLFYPKDEASLAKLIDALLAAAPKQQVPRLRALICPHAGYPYSGPCAAAAYQLLPGRRYDTVVVLAPSHYAAFRGACVSGANTFRTPLGLVPVSEQARALARTAPFVPEAPCRVQRPAWSGQASRAAPPAGEDTPDTWEHSDEVQVPFLQRTLKEFRLLPIVLGEVDAAEVARGLAPLLGETTLLVASSDLSHYHPYDNAKSLDASCVSAITNLNLEQMRGEEACGKTPILTIMNLAILKGWKARLLDYRNSGDSTGDKNGGVVGYAAVAFYEPEAASAGAGGVPAGLSKEEKHYLMELAKRTVRQAVTTGSLPEVDAKTVPLRLAEKKGCFVTLTKKGQLRGCIGHILPMEKLYQAIMDNARSAAVRDGRFPPVEPRELAELAFEISILTEPKPLEFTSPEDLLSKLRPHTDGVVLKVGGRTSTFLPQVWEQLSDKVTFLNHLSAKAGATPTDWRQPGTGVSTYQVEAFKESDL
jgi:MEMO1 family protein